MANFNPAFLPGSVYHLYNRGNNRENLFYTAANYEYFMKKYYQYLIDWVDTYVYSLMPNHFHFLFQVKTEAEREIKYLKCGGKKIYDTGEIISELFRRLFTSYSKSINIQENRVGSLFQKKMKRIEVKSYAYFQNLIYYIHANPQTHGLIRDFRKYKYSSFAELISDQDTKLMREELFNWFGTKEDFIRFHVEDQKLIGERSITLE